MNIQVTIAGFQGGPITLLAFHDPETGVLAVAKQTQRHNEKRVKEGFALVANLDLEDLDFRFSDDMMRDAIRDYFTMKAQGTITLESSVSRYQPDNKIEADQVDERGRKYRVSGDIDNGQVGILALVAFIQKQRPMQGAIDAMKDLADFYRIETF